jgi:hypothetical protein
MSFIPFTNRMRKILPAVFAIAILQFVTACGGGGGSGGGGGGAPAPNVPDLAPASIITRSMTITDPDQSAIRTTYTFDVSTYTSPSGDSGAYSYTKTTGSTTQARLQLVSQFAPVLNYNLTFTSSNGGTYVDQSGKSGPFTLQ